MEDQRREDHAPQVCPEEDSGFLERRTLLMLEDPLLVQHIRQRNTHERTQDLGCDLSHANCEEEDVEQDGFDDEVEETNCPKLRNPHVPARPLVVTRLRYHPRCLIPHPPTACNFQTHPVESR